MNELYRTLLRCLLPVSAAAFLLLPSSAQADKGMLRIVTEPGDAQIMIDGKQKGNSPSEAGQSFAIKLDEGEHIVSAVKPNGLKEHFGEKKIFVADDTMQTITLKLEERASESAKQAMTDYIPNPEMVAVPAGTFLMGCQGNDQNCEDDEKPVLEIYVPAFELGKYEVTFEMWDACYTQGGCDYYPEDKGWSGNWGRGNHPVINVSWNDIQQFLAWINLKTGKSYRLPTEPEWEYAARAGTNTIFTYGDKFEENHCDSQSGKNSTMPVGSCPANSFGVFDINSNVSEWISGCNWKYDSSRTNWQSVEDCKERVLRGGNVNGILNNWRLSNRSAAPTDYRYADLGFRLARTL